MTVLARTESAGQRQAEGKLPTRMATGVTVDCPCGATGVPLTWSSGNRPMRHYAHCAGQPYSRASVTKAAKAGVARCYGRGDVFANMLRNNRLAVSGVGLRLRTDEEREQASRTTADTNERAGQGVLF